MTNRHYRQGLGFEHKVQAALEAVGYGTVRAAGSKGAMKVDVIAVRPAGQHAGAVGAATAVLGALGTVSGAVGASRADLVALEGTQGSPDDPGHLDAPNTHLWIQCKRTGTLGPEEWNTLRRWALAAGAVPLMAENGPNGRGVTFWRLYADKVPYSRSLPRELYDVKYGATVFIPDNEATEHTGTEITTMPMTQKARDNRLERLNTKREKLVAQFNYIEDAPDGVYTETQKSRQLDNLNREIGYVDDDIEHVENAPVRQPRVKRNASDGADGADGTESVDTASEPVQESGAVVVTPETKGKAKS